MNESSKIRQLAVAGGAIDARKHIYITRADIENEIYDVLCNLDYCNILCSRQVGKTSLTFKIAMRLRDEGMRVVLLDVSSIGAPENLGVWFRDVLMQIKDQLRLQVDFREWWEQHEGDSYGSRIMAFFKELVFAENIDSPVIVFVDEIDSTLKLPYADDFFTSIRAMYNQRSSHPQFEKVAFCLIGVATPNELIKDRRTTSYNVGRSVALRDFDMAKDDLRELERVLSAVVSEPLQSLTEILHWTGGHPYLTILLCRDVIESKKNGSTIDELVNRRFSTIKELRTDVHFEQILRFFDHRLSRIDETLDTYGKLLKGRLVEDTSTAAFIELRLAGLVRQTSNGELLIRNPIYRKVFDWQWLQSLRPNRARRRLKRVAIFSTVGFLLLLGFTAVYYWVNDIERLDRDAMNLVSSIETADYSKLPDLIGELDRMRPVVDPKLKVALDQHDLQSDERLKLSLGLLPSDPGQVDYLMSRLLTAEASQVPLLVGQLQPHAREIKPQLWTTAQQHDPRTLLQAASALASYAPDSELWSSIAGPVAGQMVQVDPLLLAVWIEALQPVAKSLNPELQRIYASSAELRPQTQIDLATEILKSYTADDFKVLHELVLTGQARQFTKMFASYRRFRQPAIKALRGELARTFSHVGPKMAAEDRERLRLEYVARQAKAAVALLRLEDPIPIYDFLTVDRNPEALSQFIYRIRGRDVSPSLLIKSFQELQTKPVPQDSLQHQQHYYRLYGFLLGLGEFTFYQLPAQERDAFVVELAKMYGTHPSRAVHSALGWLLRRWGQDERVRRVDETPLDYDASGRREWYVLKIDPRRVAAELDAGETTAENNNNNSDTDTADGEDPAASKPLIDLTAPIFFTMVVFPGGEFEMGAPEASKRVNVSGPIAVSDREVTWRQFSPIDGDTHRQSSERQFWKQLLPSEPVFGVRWFEAVNYCRWLSSASGLDQSYERLEFPPGVVSRPGSLDDLPVDTEWPMRTDRPGFRLLTEAEWEYVARSGTVTNYSFGDSESLLAEYCWYETNSAHWSHSTGLLRPSVGGLFDIHGNLIEWTNDWYTKGESRVLRGGGWSYGAAYCQSAIRGAFVPSLRNNSFGFRVALSPSSQVPAEQVQGAEPSGVGTEGVAEQRPEMP